MPTLAFTIICYSTFYCSYFIFIKDAIYPTLHTTSIFNEVESKQSERRNHDGVAQLFHHNMQLYKCDCSIRVF